MRNSNISNNLDEIRELLELEQSAQPLGTDYAWYVGATGVDDNGEYKDYSDMFIENGIWENGYDTKFIDTVKSIKVGDKIALKSAYTRKKGLPFNNNGKYVGVMAIKAIGTVTENCGDGKKIKVDWQRVDPIKEWYGKGVLRLTIHLIKAEEGLSKKLLLQFTFNNADQDYSLCEEQYADDIENAEEDVFEEEKVIDLPVLNKRQRNQFPLNCILYGAPGTGKTYATAQYALAIIENKSIQDIEKCQRTDIMNRYNKKVSNGQIVFTTFHQNYGYEDFIQGIRPNVKDGKMSFSLVDGIFKVISERAMDNPDEDYVIVIDEINRANISKVFGELITLIEDDKRWGEENAVSVVLPSGDVFAVPNNLYIVGTMNSADKSISLIDSALRRRFEFIEFVPNLNLVNDTVLKTVLKKINEGISSELGSTDLLIGHSYFMNKTVNDLESIMNRKVIPLLYEYFFDNEKKVESQVRKATEGLDFDIITGKMGRLSLKKREDN